MHSGCRAQALDASITGVLQSLLLTFTRSCFITFTLFKNHLWLHLTYSMIRGVIYCWFGLSFSNPFAYNLKFLSCWEFHVWALYLYNFYSFLSLVEFLSCPPDKFMTLSSFSVEYLYMCLELTIWEQITHQGTHPWKRWILLFSFFFLFVFVLESISCLLLFIKGWDLVRFPHPCRHDSWYHRTLSRDSLNNIGYCHFPRLLPTQFVYRSWAGADLSSPFPRISIYGTV